MIVLTDFVSRVQKIHPRVRRALILGVLLLLVASTGRILFKKMTDKMPRYPYFQSIFFTAVAVPFYFVVMLILRRRAIRKMDERLMTMTSDVKCAENGSVKLTPQARQAVLIAAASAYDIDSSASLLSMRRYWESPDFPKYKLAIMGLLDALAGIMMVFGGNRTSGALQALLIQGVIPITMLLSFVFLRERYAWQQYIGAALVLGSSHHQRFFFLNFFCFFVFCFFVF
jgi:drug/metabolite transporter (DMT)-like permease